MKVTIKQGTVSSPSKINVEEFTRRAKQVFLKEVKPQIELAKKTAMPNDKRCSNGRV